MFKIFKAPAHSADLPTSSLYDQDTFYSKFMHDLNRCRMEVVIESPFITNRRLAVLMPVFKKLRQRNVRIVVNTRHPNEHEDSFMHDEAARAIPILQDIGVLILYTGGHHRKLAILDRKVMFEGSLNILSQNSSCEIMRRIESEALAQQMLTFTKLSKHIR